MDSIKIIIVVTWFGLNVFQGIESGDDIFVVGNKRCITNGSAALAIIKKISDTNVNIDNERTLYYPPYHQYECTFEQFTKCGKEDFWVTSDWSICEAIDGPVNHYITDRRWQNFPILKLDSPSKILRVKSFNSYKNFKIPFSVRFERNDFVIVSFCDEADRRILNCYRILLAETRSSIWKCTYLYIINIWSESDKYCRKLTTTDQTQNSFEFSSENAWTHFSIVRKDEIINVLRGNYVLMTSTDNEGKIYDSKSLVITSNGSSLWKFHDYQYLLSESINDRSESIGPTLTISKNTTCISMFVAMCETCCLRLTIALDAGGENYKDDKKEIRTENGMWAEQRIVIDTKGYIGKQLGMLQYKSECRGKSNKGLFWAIDDIRLCEEKEYSYIESNEEKFTCQKIGIGQNEIIKINNNELSKTGIDCPENTFGKFCVPCSIFGKEDYCNRFAYCDLDHSEQTCHCTAGYDGLDCLSACYNGFYGHGCQKSCSKNCLNMKCWKSGNCSHGCEDPYEGDTCDKSSVIFFLNPPKVTSETSTSVLVEVRDFAIDGADEANSPSYYDIEYREDPNQSMDKTGRQLKSGKWEIAREKMIFDKENRARIDNLKPDTQYLVRATVSGQKKGDYIKFSNFTTKCTDIVKENIDITTTSDSANITIQWAPDHCKFGRYKLFCADSAINNDLSNTIPLTPLQPYTEYNCTISPAFSRENIVKTFWTKEGVPSEVREVKAVTNANSISLSWKEPAAKRGNIIKYNIVCYYLGSRGSLCPSVHERNTTSTTQREITLVLKYYSNYQIEIRAVTNGGEGEGHVIKNLVTNQLDEISIDEKLGLDKFTAFADSAKIFVTKVFCGDLLGPIYLQGNAFCIHEWCSEKNVSKDVVYSEKSPFITLTNLFPYSNYTAHLAMSRDGTSWMDIGETMFQTKPSVPNPISHLEVISKDGTSISLRWMKPYPPTGVLKDYMIEYKHYYYSPNSWNKVDREYVPPQPCPLWKDYHCGHLTTNIYKDNKHSIRIYARNQIPSNFGPPSVEIKVKKENEASHPTYGISLVWDEKNDLNITWYHPNNTNGNLTSFEMHLKDTKAKGSPQPIIEYLRVGPTNYSLTYTKTIPSAKLQACTDYKASIIVHNVNAASLANCSFATSPPDIPPNIPMENLEISKTNTTITVHIPIVGSDTTVYRERIYILVSKAADTDDLVLFEQNLLKTMDNIPNLKSSWIVYESDRTNSTLDFRIGDNNQSESSLNNLPLEPGTNYSVTVIRSNQCFGLMRLRRLRRAQKFVSTLMRMGVIDKHTGDHPTPEDSNEGLWALILLIFVPLIGLGYWYKKYKYPRGSDLLIPRAKRENIALSRLPNPGGKELSAKPKRSLPQGLPPLNTTHSKPIRISDFEGYVKGVVTSGELDRQHSLFPRGLVKSCEYGSLAENKAKNRYKNLIAYDDTRVKLQKIRGEEHSDYINANYIDGYKKPRCYIATQGPKSNTLADFWRMIWQEKVRHIVMLANVYENGKKKVEKYWPDINENLTFGNVSVQHVSADIFANFDVREFTIHCNNEERKINQLHFTTWPDHGVPLYSQSLVPFLQRVLKIPYNPQSPIVVHCSAGVGRTGTIILSDICLRMAAGEGSIDFLAHLENIRSQRANLVDNIEQYKLAHLVVLECLSGLHTAVPCNKEMKKIVDGILIDYGIQKQMKYIVETQWQDSAMETMLEHEEVLPSYPEKNRFKEIIPRHYRVFLTKYPVDDDASFYINAVQVDGFRNPGRFISTQQPMPNTLGDFWRMVVERSCTTIISLNMLNLKDKTVCKFWPGNGEELNPLDTIRIQHIKTKRLECYKVITVQVKFIREEPFTVDILEMDNWKSNELLPNSIEEFLAFLDASEAISRNSERVIVTCYDGATASGLYLAMTFLIEKMKLEQECDVCLAVRTIRHSRKEFVTNEEQYEFLYGASVTFIAGFQSYSNFT